MTDSTNTEIRVCRRCQQVVLTAISGGAKTITDPNVLTLDEYRQALIAGRQVYRLVHHRLAPDQPHQHRHRPALVEHSCTGAGTKPLRKPQNGPEGSVCALWASQGWNPPPSCPRVAGGPSTCDLCCKPPF